MSEMPPKEAAVTPINWEDVLVQNAELRAENEWLRTDNSQLVARAYAMSEVVSAARECMESGPGPGNWPRFDALRRAVEALMRPNCG